MPYARTDPPLCSSQMLDNDAVAFRPRCDVVLQGNAYTYSSVATRTRVALACGPHMREIDVVGDRRAERGRDGRVRFSDAEPFEEMSLRYERAYGGVDRTALERHGLPPDMEALVRARPGYQLARQTPYHYPRNPAGRGFLIETDGESLAATAVPNLEFPFDPIEPEGLAVGHPENWVEGHLPASFDWVAPNWFPRTGWLGLATYRRGFPGPLREQEHGWLPADFLELRPVLATIGRAEVRHEYFQAASPGLSFDDVGPGTPFRLYNMHPERPRVEFRLPDEVPNVRLALEGLSTTPLQSRLVSVVIRPDSEEVVTTWCASMAVEKHYAPETLIEADRHIEWLAPR